MDPFFLLSSAHALMKALIVMFVLGVVIRVVQGL